jgi:hypothetical protein
MRSFGFNFGRACPSGCAPIRLLPTRAAHNSDSGSVLQAKEIAEGETGEKKQSMSDAALFKEAVKEQNAELKKVREDLVSLA